MFRNITGTVKLAMTAAVTLGVAASLVALGTHAGFIAQTSNGNNQFTVGVLKISNLGFNGGSFSITNLAPGLKQSNSITLTNSGTLGATMQLHLGAAADATATSGTCDSSNSTYVNTGTTCGQASLSSSLQLLVYVPASGGGVCVYPQNGTSFVNGTDAEFTAAETTCGYGALGGSGGFPSLGEPVPFGSSGPYWAPSVSQAIVFAIQLPATVQNEVLGTSTTVDFSWQSESVSSTSGSASGGTSASPTPTTGGSTGGSTITPTPSPSTSTPSISFSPTTGSSSGGTTISVSGTNFPENGAYSLYIVNTSSFLTLSAGTATVSSGVLSGSFSTQGKTAGTYYIRVLNTTSGGSTDVTSTATLTITP